MSPRQDVTKIRATEDGKRVRGSKQERDRKRLIAWEMNFNGMLTSLGSFYAKIEEKRVHCTFYLHFLCSCFLSCFLHRVTFQVFLFNTKNLSTVLWFQVLGPWICSRWFFMKSNALFKKNSLKHHCKYGPLLATTFFHLSSSIWIFEANHDRPIFFASS